MSSSNTPDLFNLAKSVNLIDYLETYHNHEFKRGKTQCHFHDDKKASVSTKPMKTWMISCHVCGYSKNPLEYVMMLEKLDAFEAAKLICINMGFYQEEDFNQRELSEEEKKAYAKKKAAQDKKRQTMMAKVEKERDARVKKEAQDQANAMITMSKKAPEFLENFQRLEGEKKEALKKLFVGWNKLSVWYFEYLGYDYENDTVCIINRRTDQGESKGDVFNIKYREKFIWDEKARQRTQERMEGKWISTHDCKTEPFPLDWFFSHDDKRVVLCEGEKDALNLLDLNVRVLTLGGVSQSWEQHAYLLKDLDVYLWFDHDAAGYESVIQRAKELQGKARSVRIVSFMHLDRTLENKYDISDYLAANNFISKEVLFNTIAYSCFGLSDQLIEEFAQFYDGTDDAKRKALAAAGKPVPEAITKRILAHLSEVKKKSFIDDIAPQLMEKSTPVKSADDEQIKELEEAIKQTNILKDILKQAVVDGKEGAQLIINSLNLKTTLINQHRKMGESDIADHLIALAKNNNTEFASYRDTVYIWNGMQFENLAPHQVIRFIVDWMESPEGGRVNQKQRTPDMVDRVIKHIKYKSTHLEPIIKHQNDNGLRVINMLNGSLHIYESGKHNFKSYHDPKDGCTSLLDVTYDENAAAPKWKKFLTRVLPDETEQKALMQFFGYTLYPKHLYETFLFLHGESGANGKSVILETMRKCFGDDMVSHLDLQQFEGHQIVGLEGKLLNIGAEIDAKGLNDGQFATLKKAAGGEPLFLNPKGTAGYNISGQLIPKLAFAGNNKPRANMDGGVFRRMIFLDFKEAIPQNERVEKLSERFNDEMGGIINLALTELSALIKAGKFAKSTGMEKAMDEYKTQTDPILAYLEEHIVGDDQLMIPRKYAYAHYKSWCEDSGHHPLAQKTFIEKLSKKSGAESKRINLGENGGSSGISNFDYFITGIAFSFESDVTAFKYKSFEIKTSHAVYSSESKMRVVREAM